MMLAPFFTQRTSGVMILGRFHYDKEATDCKNCLSYHKGCTETACPWLAERLEAGAVSYRELLKICFENLRNKRMKTRLLRLPSRCGWFYDCAHKRRFQMAQAAMRLNLSSVPPTYAAALFLLTADAQLWQCAEKGATPHGFQFGQMKLRNSSTEAYALYQTAKSLYTGVERITMSELADPEIIDDALFATMINGILIARFGTDVFKIDKSEVYS